MSLTQVVFYVGYQQQPLSHQCFNKRGVGGSETCLLQIVQHLHDTGRYQITITGEVENNVVDDRLSYIHTDRYRELVGQGSMSPNVDRVVAINYINYLEELNFLNFDNSVFWLHNTEHFPWHRGEELKNSGDHLYEDPRMSVVVCVSDWQAEIIKQKYPACESKVRVIPNCIDLQKFNSGQFDRNAAKFVYSSEPSRGLERVLDLWPSIKQLIPNASLTVFCPDYCVQGMYDVAEQYAKLNLQDVHFIGSVNKEFLYRHLEQATYWLYPSDYPETFCLTALEMMYSKTLIITSDTGNLKSLCKDRSFMYNHQWPIEQQQAQILTFLQKIQRKSDQELQTLVEDAQAYATQYHVFNIGERWDELLVKHNVDSFGTAPAFVITLKPNNQRNRDQWTRQLDQAGVKYSKLVVFEAVNGAEIDQQYLEVNGLRCYDGWKLENSDNGWWSRDILPGELGCAISHYLVWNKIKEYDIPHAFVFEDDFTSNEHQLDDQTIGELPLNWDMLYLGRNPLRPDQEQHDGKSIIVPRASYNMHAYALSRSGVQKLLDQRFDQQLMPVDEFIQCTYDQHDRTDLHYIWADSFVYATRDPIFVQSGDQPSQTETIHLPAQPTQEEEVEDRDDSQPDQSGDDVTLYDYFSKRDQWLAKYVAPGVVDMDYDLLIDEPVSNVYCFRMFTDAFCDEIVALAEKKDAWTVDRHYYYPTTDIVLGELGLNDVYDAVLADLVEPVIRHVYKIDGHGFQNMNNENFLAKYTVQNQSYLKIHHDMSDITALVNLSSPDHDFEGGGTYFPKYKALYRPAKGSMSVHPGNITHKHGARPVYKGTRYILVSFMTRNM